MVGSEEVEAKTASPGGYQKQLLLGSWSNEFVQYRTSLFELRVAVESRILPTTKIAVVVDDVKRLCELREDQGLLILACDLLQEFVNDA